MQKVIPTGNHVLVKPDEAEATVGSYVLPDSAQKKPRRGTVIAVGDGLWSHEKAIAENEAVLDYIKSLASERNGEIIAELLRRYEEYLQEYQLGVKPMTAKPGDKVYYSKFAGTEISIGGEDFVVLKEYPECLIIIPCDEPTEWLGTGELKSEESGV